MIVSKKIPRLMPSKSESRTSLYPPNAFNERCPYQPSPTTSSTIKPIDSRILHHHHPPLPRTTPRRLSPRRFHPVHLTQPPPSPHIPQLQPIHRPKRLPRHPRTRPNRSRNIRDFLCGGETGGAEVENWLEGGVEVVFAEEGDAVAR